jgi:uncharacterized protein YggE
MKQLLSPLTLLALLSLPACTHQVVVPESGDAHQRDAIAVVGSGEAEGTPNLVRITLGVEAQGPDVAQAVLAVNTKMRNVIAALQQHGVQPKDVQTQQLNIHSEERPLPPPEPLPLPAPAPPPAKGARPAPAPPVVVPAPERPPIFYRVSNGVAITLRDVQRVGEAIGAAVQAGANQAWGIQFDVEDKKPLLAQARQKAMQDARQRAQELASLAGVKLGRVLSVTEAAARDVPGPMPMPMMMESRQANVPIEAGQLRLYEHVEVVYEIAR